MRKKIAVLVGQPDESYQKSFLQGFLGQAFSDNYDVCIFAMYQKHQGSAIREQSEANIFSLLEPDLFEAIVLLVNTIQVQGTVGHIEEELRKKYQKPVIVVDNEGPGFHSVLSDNYQPVKKMISHLIEEHGFTDIAFLTGNEYHLHARQRLQGFLDCMREHGLTVGENRVFYGDFWYNSGKATAERLLLDREHLPQAVACANDYMALGLMEELQKEGIRIPEDIAVTGYDISPEGRTAPVSVTSISVPAKEIGRYCAKYAKALSKGELLEDFLAREELFVGKSCGCAQEKQSDAGKFAEEENVRSDSFEYITGSMEDDMLMQADLPGIVNTAFSYVDQIRPFEGFHLCLNTDWTEEGPEGGRFGGYTEKMLDALKCGPAGRGMDRVSLTAEFDRKVLLPELSKESERPRAFYFTPLFFEERCFGYAAINYGEKVKCYDLTYRRWLNSVMRGMEIFLRLHSLRAENARLSASQVRDALTGLYNYQGFLSGTVAEMKELPEPDGIAEIVVIELCGLGEIYGSLGSREGDKAIVDFAQILARESGQELLCYLGTGEYLAVWTNPETRLVSLTAMMEGVRQKLERYCRIYGIEGKLDIIYAWAKGQADNEEKLGSLIGEAVSKKNADKLKEQQRAQESLTEEEQKKMELVSDILDHNRLVYFFQPIVDAGTGEIFAYEALMRASTEEPVSPLDILKCAKHLGRLCDVERATFLNVLSYAEENVAQFADKKIFINSIPGTRLSPDDAEMIRDKLKNMTGKIVVELTEQAELADSELEGLKKKFESLGVDTAVDDYGTGYSNVYNLLRYMPNVVKIDRMLLANIQLSAQKQHFVKEIIEFAHNNKITVLAEGVETPEELKMVTTLGVDLIQGYYTARPKAEVISKIDYKIQNEIVQYGQYMLEKKQSKIFQAGQDGSISLIKLATGHFSKIRFVQGNVPHRDVSIVGLAGFLANMEIEIEDSYSGRIELKDVDLAVYNEHPAIRLGKNCDVTLVLRGENILEQGGILVPEGSRLTIQGDGNLSMKQIAVNGYGIGNEKDGKCGELCFEQDGLIEIFGNTMHAVGIGAGFGGTIHINSGLFSIHLGGEEAVGIGALYADTELSVRCCAVDFDINNNAAVGIGSLKGAAKVNVQSATIRGSFRGNRCVCIGTLEEGALDFVLQDGVIDMNARSGCACGIGSISGEADLSMERFSAAIWVEGKETIAMGNHKKTARIHTHNGNLVVYVKNKLGFDIGVETIEMINGSSEFVLNEETIVRESIEGEM